MITVVVGRPGMGKTVWLTSEVLRRSKKVDVYTNVRITLADWDSRKPRIHFIESLEDIVHLREGDIVLDEVQTYLNSRSWATLDLRFQLLLQQHRHRGLNIIGATQSIKRADTVFRELVQIFYEIRKIISFTIFGKSFGFFYMRQYDPDTIESSTGNFEPIGWYWLFVADPILFSVYDTFQDYRFADLEGRREVLEYTHVRKSVVQKVLTGRRYDEAPPLVASKVSEGVKFNH